MSRPRDRRQAIPSSELPKALNPGRHWHITEKFPVYYALYENCTTPEGYHTVRAMFSLFYFEPQSVWVLWTEGLRMDLPESDDPPFKLAEALYDAAK